MFCAECGTRLPETAKFCLECGHRRESRTVDTVVAPVADPVPSVTSDGRAMDPTRDVWGRPLATTDAAMSEKSRVLVRHPSVPRANVVPPAASSRRTTISLTPGHLAIASAVLVIVGSLGPWVSLVAPFVGSLSVSGTEGDGKITLGCGIAAAVMLAFLVTSNQSGVWLGLFAGIALGIAAVVGIVDWGNVGDEISTSDQEFQGLASVGWGLKVMTVGAIVGAILSIVRGLKAADLT